MVQRLLSSADFKMDPMVSLYYFAPACAAINGAFTLFFELPTLTMADIYHVGLITLLINALVAFGLNVAVVLLVNLVSISTTFPASDDFTDRQNLRSSPHTFGSAQRYPPCHGIHGHLWRPGDSDTILRLLNCLGWTDVLQARRREDATARRANQTDRGQLPARESWRSESDYDLRWARYGCLGGVQLVPGVVTVVSMSIRELDFVLAASFSYCTLLGQSTRVGVKKSIVSGASLCDTAFVETEPVQRVRPQDLRGNESEQNV